MPSNAEREAEALFRNLYQRIRQIIHPHHWEHEPGGKDEVHFPLGFVRDVTLTDVQDTEVLSYDATSGVWINKDIADVGDPYEHDILDHQDTPYKAYDAPLKYGQVLRVNEADGHVWWGNYFPLLSYCDDVYINNLNNNDVLTYDLNSRKWINKVSTGGSGVHSVHFAMPLPATVIPPGPTNVTGAALSITAVRFGRDDSTVAGTLHIGASSVALGSWGTTQTVNITWASGATISLDLTDAGSDGTYLTVDLAAG